MRSPLALLLVAAGCGRVGFAPTDARGDGPASDDSGAADVNGAACAFAFCDDFEGTDVRGDWFEMSAVAIDTTFAHRGASSIHFHTTARQAADGEVSAISQPLPFTAAVPALYVRVFMRMGSLPIGTNSAELILMSQSVGAGFENSLFLKPTSLALYNQWSDTSSGNSMPFPIDTWTCVLWSANLATTAAGSLDLAGEVAGAQMQNIQTDDAPRVDSMSFGIHLFSQNQAVAQPALDVWMDDLLVSDAPLTCAD